MSFILELEVDDLTEDQARAVEARSRSGGAWPVGVGWRRARLTGLRSWIVVKRPHLWMSDRLPDGRELLRDEADVNEPAWAMEPALTPLLAESVRILAEEMPQGFALRATWVGDEVRQEDVVSAAALGKLILASGLNEYTRYRVTPSPGSGSDDVR